MSLGLYTQLDRTKATGNFYSLASFVCDVLGIKMEKKTIYFPN
jgi:hypothetical protein